MVERTVSYLVRLKAVKKVAQMAEKLVVMRVCR